MRRRPIVPLLAGTAAGAVIAAGAIAFGSAAATPATPSPTTGHVASTTQDPAESAPAGVVANIRIVPVSLEPDFDGLRLEYDIEWWGGSSPVALPASWRLTTADGHAIDAAVLTDHDRTVTFRSQEDIGVEDVESILVTSYAVRTPLHYEISLALDGGSAELLDGREIVVDHVLEQSNVTYVQFDVDAGDALRLSSDSPFATPALTPLDDGFEGSLFAAPGTGFFDPQLAFTGTELPDVIHLEVESATWTIAAVEMPVDMGSLR